MGKVEVGFGIYRGKGFRFGIVGVLEWEWGWIFVCVCFVVFFGRLK
jgi:hypothetical protein